MSRSYIRSRFKFEHPDDIKAYGDDWIVYDEHAIAELPARELVALEVAMVTPLVDIMNGMRAGSTMGDLGATWVALKMRERAGADAPPDFAEYDPHTMLMDWEPVPDEEPGKGSEAQASQSPVPTRTRTAALPILSVVEGSPG